MVLFGMLMVIAACACGEEAVEITKKCSFSAGTGRSSFSQCLDNDYRTYWKLSPGKKAYLDVTMPSGQTCGGVYLQWYETAYNWHIEVFSDGDWATVAHSSGAYFNDSLILPENTSVFRIVFAPEAKELVYIAELHVFSEGSLPEWVQKWEPTVEKADLMLVVAHPDDELLWFGGTLPTYAGEEQKKVLVCVLVPTVPRRRIEFLDGLWTCGVRDYPIWGRYPDKYSASLRAQYEMWNKDRLWELVTGWIRQYKPDVLLTQDINGEYGHGAHRAVADACIHAVEYAADENKYPSKLDYGTWNVLKFYIHLYDENRIEMDWRRPLDAFGGKTGFDIAVEAFKKHISQQHTDYAVLDTGKTSCTLFGLYRTLVGDDVLKNNFFENIVSE